MSSQKFEQLHLEYFEADDGAYSHITELDEAKKRQITLVGHEKKIILNVYGADGIYRGSAKEPEGRKAFVNYNTSESIDVGLVYPKATGNEIRLYMNKEFHGEANDVWFVFSRKDNLYVGILSRDTWDNIGCRDVEDSSYQAQINEFSSDPSQPTQISTTRYPRDVRVALKSFDNAQYKCELDSGHITFLTPSGRSFMEAHHLIPLSRQSGYKVSLDVPENVICICPLCHRCLHHGQRSEKEPLLRELYKLRYEALSRRGLDIAFEELQELY